MSLTARQTRFVAEYLKDLNATQAAIRAGYSRTGARTEGARLLAHADIGAAIAEAAGKRLEKAELTAERVLEEVRRIALGDTGMLFDEHGHLRPIHELPPEARAMIASVEVVKQVRGEDEPAEFLHKVRLWDKGAQLGNALKYLGLLKQEVVHSGEVVHRLSTDDELRALALKLVLRDAGKK